MKRRSQGSWKFAQCQEYTLIVPGIPPSVNHYKRTRNGRYYVTREALQFKNDIGLFVKRAGVPGTIAANTYELEVFLYLGKGQRGDGDNFWKVIADGLVDAGVIHSDAAVMDWILHVRRDWNEPRTEITIRVKT